METNIKQIGFTPLSEEELISIHGGGFFTDAGRLIGGFARDLWEQAKNYEKSTYSIGPGIPV